MDEETKTFMRGLMGEFTGNLQSSIDALGVQMGAISAWKPELESKVADLQSAVGELQRSSRAYQPHVTIDIPPAPSTVPVGTGKVTAADLGMTLLGAVPGQSGHGVAPSIRGSPSGFFGSPAAPPATGPTVTPFSGGLAFPLVNPNVAMSSGAVLGAPAQAIPAMGFPRFDGENPRLWRTMCEQYFHMYSVDRSYWLSMATLNFSTSAAIWL
jgi:hypothetical protein